MDIEMTSETTPDGNIWDLQTDGAIVPIIQEEKENAQIASIACFIEYGTIPQLPEMGVDWASYLAGTKTFGEIDAEIRQSLINAGMQTYRPDYKIVGDKLTLSIVKPTEERKII